LQNGYEKIVIAFQVCFIYNGLMVQCKNAVISQCYHAFCNRHFEVVNLVHATNEIKCIMEKILLHGWRLYWKITRCHQIAVIVTDNGTNFISACNKLKKSMGGSM